MKIACVGECTVDKYLNLAEPDAISDYVGGISLNFAVHAKQCGAEQVSLVSCIGDDAAGQTIVERLSRKGIDTSHLSMQSGRTAQQKIRLLKNGERIFPSGGFDAGVLAQFRLSSEALGFIAGHDILAVPVYPQIEHIFEQVTTGFAFSGQRVTDFLDGSDSPDIASKIEAALDYLDLVFISGTAETVDLLRPLSRRYQGLIIVTLGAEGSVAMGQGIARHQPAIRTGPPIDTTGCGDAFQAAFTVTYFRTGNVAAALLRGAQQATIVLGHYGAIG